MKKRAVLLTFLLAGTMGTNVLAADVTLGESGTQNIDVQAKYVDASTNVTVYSVDITWGAMEFTYTESGSNIWNPGTHAYDLTSDTIWTSNGNTITVTNHSNAEVTAAFAYTPATGFEELTGTFSINELVLATAENTTVDAAPGASTQMEISGALDKDLTTPSKIGTITVTFTE